MESFGDWLALGVALIFLVPFFFYLGLWLFAFAVDIKNSISGTPTRRSEQISRDMGSDYEPNATDPGAGL